MIDVTNNNMHDSTDALSAAAHIGRAPRLKRYFIGGNAFNTSLGTLPHAVLSTVRGVLVASRPVADFCGTCDKSALGLDCFAMPCANKEVVAALVCQVQTYINAVVPFGAPHTFLIERLVPVGSDSVVAFTLDTPPHAVSEVAAAMNAYAIHASNYPCLGSTVDAAPVLLSRAQGACPPGRLGPDCLYFCTHGWISFDHNPFFDVGADQLHASVSAMLPQCQLPPGCGSTCVAPLSAALGVCTSMLDSLSNATLVDECNSTLAAAHAACPFEGCYDIIGTGFEHVIDGSAAAAAAEAHALDADTPTHVAATLSVAGYSPDSWTNAHTTTLVTALSHKLGGIPASNFAVTSVGLPAFQANNSAGSQSTSSSSTSTTSTSSSSSSDTAAATGRRRLHTSSSSTSSSSDFTATADAIVNGSTLQITFSVNAKTASAAVALAAAMSVSSPEVQLALLTEFGLSNVSFVQLTHISVVRNTTIISPPGMHLEMLICLKAHSTVRSAAEPAAYAAFPASSSLPGASCPYSS
jgi:hypothetical protein